MPGVRGGVRCSCSSSPGSRTRTCEEIDGIQHDINLAPLQPWCNRFTMQIGYGCRNGGKPKSVDEGVSDTPWRAHLRLSPCALCARRNHARGTSTCPLRSFPHHCAHVCEPRFKHLHSRLHHIVAVCHLRAHQLLARRHESAAEQLNELVLHVLAVVEREVVQDNRQSRGRGGNGRSSTADCW